MNRREREEQYDTYRTEYKNLEDTLDDLVEQERNLTSVYEELGWEWRDDMRMSAFFQNRIEKTAGIHAYVQNLLSGEMETVKKTLRLLEKEDEDR
uniref:DUF5082 domain-containing protein n=1 Tax=Eubacterium cellulosolvens (strain ATCC 43171 / JCM 9499 / 6) TaxID=633697 RepID=I5AQK4_EUBC6